MTTEEVLSLADKWGYGNELGEVWLERAVLAKQVNSVPPQNRHKRLRSLLRTLRGRLKRLDRPPREKTAGMADFDPKRVRRQW